VRIDVLDPSEAASFMRLAIGRFQAELLEEHGRWYVLLQPDRPEAQLLLDAIELTQQWLDDGGASTAALSFRGRIHELRARGAPAASAAVQRSDPRDREEAHAQAGS
jgi:hypothetical protein